MVELTMNCPNPQRLKAIAEHVHSLGAYTQAEEINLAAQQLEALNSSLNDAASLRESDLDAADDYVQAWRILTSNNPGTAK